MEEVIYPPSEQMNDVEIERCRLGRKLKQSDAATGLACLFGASRASKQEDGEFIKYLLPSLQ